MNNNEFSMGTLYDANKNLMKKEKPMTAKEIDKIRPQLEAWFNWHLDSYAMLLCRERYDFTVFHLYVQGNRNPPEIAVQELIELLKERGSILSMDEDVEQKAWEIWIKINEEPFAYYLFNCDDWVIEC